MLERCPHDVGMSYCEQYRLQGLRCQECPLIGDERSVWDDRPWLGTFIGMTLLMTFVSVIFILMLVWYWCWLLLGYMTARAFFSKHLFKIAWLMPPETAHHFSLHSIRVYGALMNFIGRMCSECDLGSRISNHVLMRAR